MEPINLNPPLSHFPTYIYTWWEKWENMGFPVIPKNGKNGKNGKAKP